MTTEQLDVDAHTALLKSRLGGVVAGILFAVMATWIVAPNMPPSTMRGRVDILWWPAYEIGISQDWGVFSPNPRAQSIDVRALLEYDDGSTDFWDIEDFDPFVGAYREYRWNKWQERVRLDSRDHLWEPTAVWIAEQRMRDGVLPERVTLVRRWIDHEPLTGEGAVDSGWNEFAFFVWERDA